MVCFVALSVESVLMYVSVWFLRELLCDVVWCGCLCVFVCLSACVCLIVCVV